MKKLTNEERQEFDLLESNYYVPRSQVLREHENIKKQRNWCLIFAGLVLASSSINTYFALETSREAKKIQTIVYKDDGKGSLTILKAIQSDANIEVGQAEKNSYIRNQLREYVAALYSVPNDKDMRQENVYKVMNMTNKTYYEQIPKKIFQGSFAQDANSGVISIVVKTPVPVGENGKVWQVDWTKKQNGEEIGKFKSWITFKQIKIDNVVVGSYNPLGLVITNIDTQADL